MYSINPQTLHPEPNTSNREPETRPYILYPKPETLNPIHATLTSNS